MIAGDPGSGEAARIEQAAMFLEGECVGHTGDVIADSARRALAARTIAALLPSRRQQFRLRDEEIEQLAKEAGIIDGTVRFEDYADDSFAPEPADVQAPEFKVKK